VRITDAVPPQVTGITGLPAEGATTQALVSSFSVQVSEGSERGDGEQRQPAGVELRRALLPLDRQLCDLVRGRDAGAGVGRHLVTINDADEQAWLQRAFGRYGAVWTGLTDQATEGTWVWASGEPVTYSNWASGSRMPIGDYDFAYLSDGYWYSYATSSSCYRAVLEFAGTDTDGDGIPDALDGNPNDTLNTWDLRSAGSDGVFETADDRHYTLKVNPAYVNGTTIGFQVDNGPLLAGQYRFTATAALRDRAGNALDGNGDGVGVTPTSACSR